MLSACNNKILSVVNKELIAYIDLPCGHHNIVWEATVLHCHVLDVCCVSNSVKVVNLPHGISMRRACVQRPIAECTCQDIPLHAYTYTFSGIVDMYAGIQARWQNILHVIMCIYMIHTCTSNPSSPSLPSPPPVPPVIDRSTGLPRQTRRTRHTCESQTIHCVVLRWSG